MAIRKIRLDGDPILRKISREVEVVDDRIKQLILDMFETMEVNNGVGLAAPQVGVLRRVIVIDITGMEEGKDEKDNKEQKYALVNPVITVMSGEQCTDEGCLSFPNMFGKVKRPMNITVEALNENGEKITIEAEGLLAQAIAHEIDHLNGVLFVDIVEKDSIWMEE